MGLFFVNYHLKTTDNQAVETHLQELVSRRACVSPPKHGWVTVFDEASDSHDSAEIDRLARELSHRLQTVLIAFVVHDSQVFAYYLFDQGDLIDEYNSAPDYLSHDLPEEARLRLAGQPAVWRVIASRNHRRRRAGHPWLAQVFYLR